jgi:hypothetical protein
MFQGRGSRTTAVIGISDNGSGRFWLPKQRRFEIRREGKLPTNLKSDSISESIVRWQLDFVQVLPVVRQIRPKNARNTPSKLLFLDILLRFFGNSINLLQCRKTL